MQTVMTECTKSLVIKTTGACNLRCDYCYEGDYQKMQHQDLPLSIVEEALGEYVASVLLHSPDQRTLYVIWHGGEPLLRGIQFFDSVLRIEQALQRNAGLAFRNAVQTNCTLVDATWARFLRENLFEVGVSLDGPIGVNKIHRSSFDAAINGMRLLSSFGLKSKVIVVVSDSSYSFVEDIHSFFSKEVVAYVDFVPCYRNNGKHSLHPDHYQSFMIRLFDLWVRDGKPYPIRLFDDIIRIMEGTVRADDFVTCSLLGKCGAIFSITSEGDVYYCDCLPKVAEYRIGAIQQGLPAIQAGVAFRSLRDYTDGSRVSAMTVTSLTSVGAAALTAA